MTHASYKMKMRSPGIKAVLTSAILEWILIFLLFINALFSYLITKFARSFKLQTPCLICSRLDHVIGEEKPGFFRDLYCSSHKLEMSSIVFCNVHNKLADVHGLCEGCLFSFATEEKSNSETFRLLVGKLGTDLIQDTNMLPSSMEKHCTCCAEQFRYKLYTDTLLRSVSIEPEITGLEDPLMSSVERTHFQSGLTKKVVEVSKPKMSIESKGLDHLSRVGYTEVEITSDVESDVSYPEDDNVNIGCDQDAKKCGLNDELTSECIETLESRTSRPEDLSTNDLAVEKLIHQDSMPEPSFLFLDVQLHNGKPRNRKSLTSAVDIGHGLEELNWHQEQNSNPSVLSELISLREAPPSTDFKGSLDEVPAKILAVKETDEREEARKSETSLVTETEPNLKKDDIVTETEPTIPKLMDLSEAYKLAVSNKVTQLSSSLAEQLSKKSSTRVSDDLKLLISQSSPPRGLDFPLNEISPRVHGYVNDDLKLLLSQLSAARGLDLSLSDMSPRVHGGREELKISSDPSGSIGMQILQKRISLERNESNLSLDGSIVTEIEGECVVDRLKRQVEFDRKSMSALYKELEEERNASAIAANQAMAMITRLQEEKASLHMEALQYLRLMEEQSEYDVEALQRANDLLAQREKEIQDLEAEVGTYKKNLEPMEEIQKAWRHKNPEGSDTIEKADTKIPKDSLVDFEKERLYILESLKKLERKLYLFSNYGVQENTPNGTYSSKETHEVNDLEHTDSEENHQFKQSPESKETDLVALLNEVSDLNERLKALEADRKFLEHTINSLRNGDEGVQFIKEISHHLEQLREMGIRREEKSSLSNLHVVSSQ